MTIVPFACTMCGRCCTNLRLPVSLREAHDWLRGGGEIQVFCEAIPWPDEPPAGNLPAHYKRRRSFAGSSGTLPLRVIVSLMASFDGPCPNLLPDRRCGIYERRPATCRIYPAEVNPFIALEPANKLCPPDAWSASHAPILEDGRWVDPEVSGAIERMREADAADVDGKAWLCHQLGIAMTGLSNEGMVRHTPTRTSLLTLLESALAAGETDERGQADAVTPWQVVSNRQATLAALASAGANFASHTALPDGASYLAFFPAA